MFKEVEDKVIAAIQASALGPLLKTCKPFGTVTLKSIQDFTVIAPAVLVAITEADIIPEAQYFEVEPSVVVFCIGQDVKRQDLERRRTQVGAYAILNTVLGLLWNSTLGLEDPAGVPAIRQLRPERIGMLQNADGVKLQEMGYAVYYAIFSTGWTIEEPAEGDTTYVEQMGIEYFLKPGDDEADLMDDVTLNGGE